MIEQGYKREQVRNIPPYTPYNRPIAEVTASERSHERRNASASESGQRQIYMPVLQ